MRRLFKKGYDRQDVLIDYFVKALYCIFASIPFLQYSGSLELLFTFLSLLAFNSLLLFCILFVKMQNKYMKFFVINPLLYLLFLVGLIYFFIRFPLLPEKVTVVSIIVLIIVSMVYFILKSSFILLRYIVEKQESSYIIPLLILATFGFLVMSDLMFAYFIYDLTLGLYEIDHTINFWDRLYFSFSIHFMTPLSSQGELIESYLLLDYIGQFTMNAHVILNKVKNITIIGFIGSLFVKWLNNLASK